MNPAHFRWLAIPLLVLNGCTASDDGPVGRVQPAFVHYNSATYYDGYDEDLFYGGPGYWPGYYYPNQDYWAHRHFRRHHRPDGGFAFSPHRGVTCNPRAQACFGRDGVDPEWTDTVFGDTQPNKMRSRVDQQQFPPQIEAPESDGFEPVQPMRQDPRAAPAPLLVPQPQQK